MARQRPRAAPTRSSAPRSSPTATRSTPSHLWLDESRPRRPAVDAGSGPLAELEREAILRALEHVGGNRRKAAELLGIGERTLYDKLKKYGD